MVASVRTTRATVMTWAMTWVTKWEMTCQVVMVAAPPHFREHPGADLAVATDDLRLPEHRVAPEQEVAMDDHLRLEHQGVPGAGGNSRRPPSPGSPGAPGGSGGGSNGRPPSPGAPGGPGAS